MKKRAVLGVLAVLLVAGLVFLRSRTVPEPVYGGKPAMAWVLLLTSPVAGQREESIAMLGQFDARAEPVLVRALEARPNLLQRALIRYHPRLPARLRLTLFQTFKPYDPALRRLAAARAIPHVSFPAEQTVPALSNAFLRGDDTSLAWAAGEALTSLGHPGLKVLFEALDHPDYQIRHRACAALTGAPSEGLEPWVPRLIPLLSDPAPQVAAQAIQVLARMAPLPLPYLLEALEHPSAAQRAGAARALSRMPPHAEPPLDKLFALIHDASPEVRAAALDALARLRPASRRVIQALITALDQPELEIRRLALHHLRPVSAGAGPALPALIRILETGPPELGVQAVNLLGAMGDQARPALPALRQLRHHPDFELRAAARAALQAIEP